MAPPRIVVLRPDAAERAGRSIPVAELASPLLREAHDLWSALRGARLFPAREAVTPVRFKRFLRNLALIRVVDDGADFEFRVVGDAYHAAHGFTAQGLRTREVDALSPGFGTASRRLFRLVQRGKAPLALRGTLDLAASDAAAVQQESVHLPLGLGDDSVDHILSVAVFADRSVADC